MSKTKISPPLTTLNGVNVHERIKNGQTDYILSRTVKRITANSEEAEKHRYISKFNTDLQRPAICSYKTQHEAESAAIHTDTNE